MSTGAVVTEGMSDPLTRFSAGDLEVDIGQQRVTRDGIEVPLPKLSFDLLVTLAAAAPNYVSLDQLLDRVWPGLVVSDKTVSQRVKLLRDALGDNAEQPRYVGALRGRGYRLVAPVVPISDRSAQGYAPTPAPRPTKSRAVPMGATLVLLGTIAVGVVFWWTMRTPVPDSPARGGIAVLPFTAASADGESTFLATGIADGLHERLSSIVELEVIGRDSSFRMTFDDAQVPEIAKRLGARYVLAGRVKRNGEDLELVPRLLDAETGREIWTEHLVRPFSDLVEVEDYVAAEVVAALRPQESGRRNISRYQPNVDAYIDYLRGRSRLTRWSLADAQAAEHFFSSAIEKDPEFAAAYAALYDARMLAADRAGGAGNANPGRELMEDWPLSAVSDDNQHLIDRALALDPVCGAAYFVRAMWAKEDSPDRELDFRKGIALDPSNGRGITAFAEYLDRNRRPDEAQEMLQRALEIDPVSPRPHFWRAMRLFPTTPLELERGMLEVLEVDPEYQPALQRYAKYRWLFHGDIADSLSLIERALSSDPGNPWLTHTAVAMALDLRDERRAAELLASAAHPEIAGELLLRLYRSDVLGAGELAFRDTALANGDYENWGWAEALRDWALLTGDARVALDYLSARTGTDPSHTVVKTRNFRILPVMAQLLMQLERRDEGRRLLAATIQWIDDYHLPNLGTVYALRVKSTALLLAGESDLALQALDASFRGGDYLQWWYSLERDPLWKPFHEDPRFRRIAERVSQHIESERAAIAN